MIIPMRGPDNSTSPQEWAMIELNGELVMPKELPTTENNENESDSLLGSDRVELGAIRFSDEGKPVMTLGSHELRGSIVVLKEPFAILKKRKRSESDTHDQTSIEYQVTGLVTKKFLFDRYPKSIMR